MQHTKNTELNRQHIAQHTIYKQITHAISPLYMWKTEIGSAAASPLKTSALWPHLMKIVLNPFK